MNIPEQEYYRPDIFSFTGENIEIVFDKAKQKSFSVYRSKYRRLKTLKKMLQQTVILTKMTLTRTALTQQ